MDPQSHPSVEERARRCVEDVLGVGVTSLEPIHEGLGLRTFLRVHTAGTPGTVVVRVEAEEDPASRPPGISPEPPLEPLRTFLAEHGLPVPRRFGGSGDTELLEDLGSESLARAVRNAGAAEAHALYEEACDLVARLQRAGLDRASAIPAFERRMDRTLLAYKAELFIEWSLPEALGRTPREAEAGVVREAFEAVAEWVEAAPRRLAHRDLQSSNLYVRAGRPPGERLAMIDFQGALMAPPEYDLVCLLRDSYVELAEEEVGLQLQRIRPRLPDPPEPEAFQKRFDALTLTRKGKDHARFLYAAATRGARELLAHVPATARYLKRAAARCAPEDPRLARFADVAAGLPEAPCAA